MPEDRLTTCVTRLLLDNGFRVSLFHNSGSLLGTVPAFVEGHALRDAETFIVRVYNDEHDDADYVCVCRLAESCGMLLEE